MTSSRPHVFAAIILTAVILAALCILTPRMKALRSAKSADFWYATANVNLGTTAGGVIDQPSEVIFDREHAQFVFGSQYPFYTYSDNPYHAISEADAAADFPRVRHELDNRAALNAPDDFVATGYKRWNAIAGYNGGLPGLFDCIDSARVELVSARLRGEIPNTRLFEFRDGLQHVVRASRLYWVCFVFEALYLPAIIWFGFWPYLRRAGLRRKLLHAAAAPFLLFLPFWFGYCNSASPAFPLGGILYPFICGLAPSFPGNFRWEYEFLATLPPFLSVITQGRIVTFADYFNLKGSIPRQFGPANVAFVSCVITAIAVACHTISALIRKHRDRPRQGFPVLSAQPDAPFGTRNSDAS
jgi:hypothetical protein